jgi:hypothetical protein
VKPAEFLQILTVDRASLAEVHLAIVRNDKILVLARPGTWTTIFIPGRDAPCRADQ